MSPLVSIVLYGWIPFVIYLFTRFSPQRAVVISFVGAVLFLPMATLPMPNPVPGFDKTAAACYSVLLATMIYSPARFSSFKFGWLDVPMLIWSVLCPIASQLENGLSPYSPTLAQIMTWGLPYFLGRIYFNSLEGMRQLAIGIFAGGLIYMPFCFVENFTGPLLHLKVYGFNAFEDWGQAKRLGGWRPVVFMQHGLMVGFWMMAATLIGICLWRSGVIKKLWGWQIPWLVTVLSISFLLCRSTGAYNLLVFGIVILFVAKRFRTYLLLLAMVFYISSYLYAGASGSFSGADTVALVRQVFGEERAESIEFRFTSEELLGAKARQKELFGWGGSGGNRILDELSGKDLVVTDSFWMLTFGVHGIFGLISWATSLLLPVVSFFTSRYSARSWFHPKVAPATAVAMVIVLYVYDCLLNSMINPVFALATGGIAGLVLKPETNKVKGDRPQVANRVLAQPGQQSHN